MIKEPEPHLSKAGRYTLYIVGGLISVVILSLMVNACVRRPVYKQAERPWGEGYESPQGYHEPDHGFMYYWWMNQLLRQNVQPTYHVYVPPQGAPPDYRPWQYREYMRDDSGRFVRRPPEPVRAPSPQSTGGFAPTTPAKSSPAYRPPSPSPQSTGGFKSSPSRSPQSSSGFKPSSSSPSRSPQSSSGFKSSSPSSSRSSPQSTSGFKSAAPKSPQSSGGFKKK